MDADLETLKLIAAGGQAAEGAIKALFNKYRKPMLGFLLSRGVDAATAEDLVQEAFIKLARGAASFRGQSKVSSWMYAILRNLHLDQARRARPEVNLDEDDWAIVETSAAASKECDPAGKLQDRQLAECLDRQYGVFAQKHPAAASALEKASQLGWTIKDVAQFLGRTEIATKEYLSQCRKKLRVAWASCHELWRESP